MALEVNKCRRLTDERNRPLDNAPAKVPRSFVLRVSDRSVGADARSGTLTGVRLRRLHGRTKEVVRVLCAREAPFRSRENTSSLDAVLLPEFIYPASRITYEIELL